MRVVHKSWFILTLLVLGVAPPIFAQQSSDAVSPSTLEARGISIPIVTGRGTPGRLPLWIPDLLTRHTEPLDNLNVLHT